MCQNCIEESGDFHFCDRCNYYYHSDDWDFDQDCCINCKREDGIIKGWHDHKKEFELDFFEKEGIKFDIATEEKVSL